MLEQFEAVEESADAMKALQLKEPEKLAFATAALSLRFGDQAQPGEEVSAPAPITAAQLVEVHRSADFGNSL